MVWAAPIVTLVTNYGDIVIDLNSLLAPGTVENFLEYANSDFYDNLVFHRVIQNFMIQGGGYDLSLNKRTPRDPIVNESYNGLSNLRGTIAMARTSDPNSATSEFFINHVDNLFLDRANAADGYGYCVFGEVISGMAVVDTIAALPKLPPGTVPGFDDLTVSVVIIQKVIAQQVYVSPTGNDTTGDGSIATPYATIQKGIDMAVTGGHVALLAGAYTGTGNRDNNFNGKAITVRSEYPSSVETMTSTIIDCQGSALNQHQGFIFNNGESADSVLKGLTIKGGYSSSGGGIYCDNSSPTINSCQIIENTADNGGGIYCTGASPDVSSCLIAGNTSSVNGGGVYGLSSNAVMTNCDIVGNTAAATGGAIYSSGGNPVIRDSIVWGNLGLPAVVGNVDMSFTDVQGGWPGTGNIDVDPAFVDAAAGDYHLKSAAYQWDPVGGSWGPSIDGVTSRCIDAGNPSVSLALEQSAVPGDNVRINMGVYGGKATASISQVGWALRTDISNDGTVDLNDFQNLAKTFDATGQRLPADFDRTGQVGVNDFVVFTWDWTDTTPWH